MVGGQGAIKSKEAWHQVYRALEHGVAKSACKDQTVLPKFPKAIQDFANTFVTMQAKRHKADYDPQERYYKSSVLQDIAEADDVISRFQKTSKMDRRAFAAFVLFKKRY
jgi:hypothetical protein